jgi:SAM-dependent methyltransferase
MITPPEGKPFRIRLAGAYQARDDDPDMIGVDDVKTDAVDYVMDLAMMPWPIEESVVDRICTAFHYHRLDPGQRVAFVNECYRVLKPRGQLILVVPYWSSMRSITDPRAKWPPICELSFAFLQKELRDKERIDFGLTCDFDFGCGTQLDGDLDGRCEEYKAMASKHQTNTVHDLYVTLTSRKPSPEPEE